MRVLVTNDDGIRSEGLRVLAAAAAAAGFTPVVAAPLRDHSGIGTAMTGAGDDGKVVAERADLPGLPGVPAYAVGASPAFIVILGLHEAFGPPPDAVLAGVNVGPNLGRVVLHSGTVGAALAAGLHRLPAMAFSLACRPAAQIHHWATAEPVVRALLPMLRPGARLREAAERDPQLFGGAGPVLNVNVPNRPVSELAGVRRAGLTSLGSVQIVVRERGAGFVRLSLEERDTPLEPDSDEALLLDGYATVTPLSSVGEAAAVRLDGLPDRLPGPAGRLPWQAR